MNRISILAQSKYKFPRLYWAKKFEFLVGFVSSFDGLANHFPMVFIWMQLFTQIKTFVCQLLKENLVIQLITNLKIHYSSSGHDQITTYLETNPNR